MKLNLKTLRISILAMLVMTLVPTFIMANGPTGNDKATNRLMEQVQEMVEVPEMNSDLNGKAVVTFKVLDNDRIEVVKVLSSNPALVEHVEDALEGKRIKDYKLDYNQKIRFNLTFNDQRL